MRSSSDEEYSHLCKIILLGDSGVGKSNLLNTFLNVPKPNCATLGVSFGKKTISLKNGEKMKAQFWDTAGQEKYRSITTVHFRGASGALLVYDITDEKTYENAKNWLNDLKNQAEENLVIILVGNKLDKSEKYCIRQVEKQKAEDFAKENNLLFRETSAFTLDNVTEIFETLIEKINSDMKKKDNINTDSDHNNSFILTSKKIEKEERNNSCNC